MSSDQAGPSGLLDTQESVAPSEDWASDEDDPYYDGEDPDMIVPSGEC